MTAKIISDMEAERGHLVSAIREMTDCYGNACTSNAALAAANRDLRKSLHEMLEIYWGEGDGELPEPQCILNARAALAKAGA